MAIYDSFLPDFQSLLADIGVQATVSGNLYLVGLSRPMTTPRLDAGGFTEERSWTVRFAACPAPWTASDGRVGGQTATLSSGAPIAALGTGKKLTVNGQVLRVRGQSYKQGSAVIELDCIDDNQ